MSSEPITPSCFCGQEPPGVAVLREAGYGGALLSTVSHLLGLRKCNTGGATVGSPPTTSLPVLTGETLLSCENRAIEQLIHAARKMASAFGEHDDNATRTIAAFLGFLQSYRGSPFDFVIGPQGDGEQRGLCEHLVGFETGRDGVDRKVAQKLIGSAKGGTLTVAVMRHPVSHRRVLQLTLAQPQSVPHTVHLTADFLGKIHELGACVRQILPRVAVLLGSRTGLLAKAGAEDPSKRVSAIKGLGLRWEGTPEDLSAFAEKLEARIAGTAAEAFEVSLTVK